MVRPTARSIRWGTLLGGAAGAQLVLWAARSEFSRGEGTPLLPLRIAAILLCLGAAFILDDEAGATVESTVATLAVRRGVRLALTIPLVGMAWGVVLWTASGLVDSGAGIGPVAHQALPVAALTVEAAAMLSVTLAASVLATRWLGHGKGGVAGGPTLLAFVMAVVSMQPYWRMFLSAAGEPGWAVAHAQWALILAAALILLAGFSLDPARRSRLLPRNLASRTHRLVGRAVRAPLGGKP